MGDYSQSLKEGICCRKGCYFLCYHLHISLDVIISTCLNASYNNFVFQSSGSEVVDYLQRVCSNDINIPVGGIVHTGMQNEHGGYENDCMIVRQEDNS